MLYPRAIQNDVGILLSRCGSSTLLDAFIWRSSRISTWVWTWSLVDVLVTESDQICYRRCETTIIHHHLVCRGCRWTIEVHNPDVPEWAETVAEAHGFNDVDPAVLQIFGLCPHCTAEDRRRRTSAQIAPVDYIHDGHRHAVHGTTTTNTDWRRAGPASAMPAVRRPSDCCEPMSQQGPSLT